jgi:hypothetical protein
VNVMAGTNQFSKEAKADLHPIAENSRFAEAAEKLAKYQGELRELRAAIDRKNAAWYGKQQGSIDKDAIGLADRMLSGQNTADDRDSQTKIRALFKKLAIIQPAIIKQSELVNLIRAELSAEAGALVQSRHRKALAKILEAARQLVEAAAAERASRGELLDLGFEVIDTFTPAPRFAVPHILGDESWYDSLMSHFKRHLEELGIPT